MESEFQVEPMQQPIHRIVGRPRDPNRVLALLEDMQLFVRNIAKTRELIREGEYFPIRKVVGRPDRLGG